MQFTNIIAPIAALALGSNAAVIGQRQGALAQFRTFTGTDCFTGNNGFTQIWPETLNTCQTFGGDSVYSVNLEQIANGCTGKPKPPFLLLSHSDLPPTPAFLAQEQDKPTKLNSIQSSCTTIRDALPAAALSPSRSAWSTRVRPRGWAGRLPALLMLPATPNTRDQRRFRLLQGIWTALNGRPRHCI
jgi:hypothetical protein